jgi:hypothetical protein
VFGKCLDGHGNGSAGLNSIDSWDCAYSINELWTLP